MNILRIGTVIAATTFGLGAAVGPPAKLLYALSQERSRPRRL
ncbi:MAG: hypothetical protein ACI8TX_002925 [Hyphomicrobiaceae bacterium]|jgi:hypothetical protein